MKGYGAPKTRPSSCAVFCAHSTELPQVQPEMICAAKRPVRRKDSEMRSFGVFFDFWEIPNRKSVTSRNKLAALAKLATRCCSGSGIRLCLLSLCSPIRPCGETLVGDQSPKVDLGVLLKLKDGNTSGQPEYGGGRYGFLELRILRILRQNKFPVACWELLDWRDTIPVVCLLANRCTSATACNMPCHDPGVPHEIPNESAMGK
ncbi:LOW QUALITY PROTEIN: hypothetical protein N5P37_001123 [Trichoderma harzianum]|nr:LOW QUALITY PROTEIN: hypothetical protein N5P37_001123 [Trichoderma harzianum]